MRISSAGSELDKNPFALSASTLIGAKVQNKAGKELGKIDEVMIDLHRGCIAYVVLSFGGFLALGDKLIAIPWQALMLDKERIVFDVDREVLENAPGFGKDQWPDTTDDAWLREVYIYYGHTPYWEEF